MITNEDHENVIWLPSYKDHEIKISDPMLVFALYSAQHLLT